MRVWLVVTAVQAMLAFAAPDAARAQQLGVATSEIILIDIERLLTETEYGQRLQREMQEERNRLIARNEQLASELEQEEQALTDLRSETAPAAFREMADAFDAKVTQLRNDAERQSQELERRRELAPLQFLRVVQPLLTDLLEESQAVVMLDLRSVLLHDTVADMTDLVIMRINERFGEGPEAPPSPETGAESAPDLPPLPEPSGDGAVADQPAQ